MDWLSEHAWAVWTGPRRAPGMAELMSLDLVLAMLAVGALAGAVTAALGAGVPAQVLVAGAASVAMLALVRPSLVARLHQGPDLVLGTSKLLGQRATVTQRMTGLAGRPDQAGAARPGPPRRTTSTRRSRPAPPSRSSRSAARRRTSTRFLSSTTEEESVVPLAFLILAVLLLLFVVVLLAKTVRIVPQARAGVVERFGKYLRRRCPPA